MNASTSAPDLFVVNDTELADEMTYIDTTPPIQMPGPVTIRTGVRCRPGCGGPQPVVIIEFDGQHVHFIALPGDTA